MPRGSFYRSQAPQPAASEARPRPNPERALGEEERRKVLDVLHSERFVDQAPAAVYHTLLDEGVRFCSVRTMYRTLDSQGEVRERRNSSPTRLTGSPNF